jgi:hypothetical protein
MGEDPEVGKLLEAIGKTPKTIQQQLNSLHEPNKSREEGRKNLGSFGCEEKLT